ncbi:predicted protein [Naegleria gruberi]|uniref:Predicted protein n=1 Tax=Naegleria gruberi TaxID=5762 RepID=D2VQM2_NAEGR|nr:uncharacterized protein NAEGRDRAFT_71275 [Naegleria gruberi]EFC40896.1 predicted protein [Naegleria gruberi]|eukprot:XP_002673640.1 predicted protein [Naegleria gruberi strain NEG-M]
MSRKKQAHKRSSQNKEQKSTHKQPKNEIDQKRDSTHNNVKAPYERKENKFNCLQVPEVVMNIFSFAIQPAVLFRYNLVCRVWNLVVDSENFYNNYIKELKPVEEMDLIDRVFMWTEYCSIYEPILYEHYLDFKRRMIIASESDKRDVHLKLISKDEVFSFKLSANNDYTVIEIESLQQPSFKFVSHKYSYYSRVADEILEDYLTTNERYLSNFKEAHFPNVPNSGFYSILESLVMGRYCELCWFLRELQSYTSRSQAIQSYYNFTNPDNSILERTLVYQDWELTSKLVNRGHFISKRQLENMVCRLPNSKPFVARFVMTYLKFNKLNIEDYFKAPLETLFDTGTFHPGELCKIFIEEGGVKCPEVLIDIVGEIGSMQVNYEALDYLKSVYPSLICPLDTRSIRKQKKPNLRFIFQDEPQYKKEYDVLYLSKNIDNMYQCTFLPNRFTSLNSQGQHSILKEMCNGIFDAILFRPVTFDKDFIETILKEIKEVAQSKPVALVCFYSKLCEHRQMLRELFKLLKDVYLIIEQEPYPSFALYNNIFQQDNY